MVIVLGKAQVLARDPEYVKAAGVLPQEIVAEKGVIDKLYAVPQMIQSGDEAQVTDPIVQEVFVPEEEHQLLVLSNSVQSTSARTIETLVIVVVEGVMKALALKSEKVLAVQVKVWNTDGTDCIVWQDSVESELTMMA